MKTKSKRGGARKGAGRKPMGKSAYTVTLTQTNVAKARRREKNFSGLLDQLIAAWLEKNP
jgi:hypothetical protein